VAIYTCIYATRIYSIYNITDLELTTSTLRQVMRGSRIYICYALFIGTYSETLPYIIYSPLTKFSVNIFENQIYLILFYGQIFVIWSFTVRTLYFCEFTCNRNSGLIAIYPLLPPSYFITAVASLPPLPPPLQLVEVEYIRLISTLFNLFPVCFMCTGFLGPN